MAENHADLTGAELHEPKGASGATLGDVYVSDGAGSGAWEHAVAHFGGYVEFDSATPAYQHSVTTSDTVVDPTFVETSSDEFTSTGTPNARVTYTGSDPRDAFVHFSASVQQTSGSGRDIEVVFYKNGSALEGSRVIITASTSAWTSLTMAFDFPIVTNDYIEVFIKASSNTTIDFAEMYMGIQAPLD